MMLPRDNRPCPLRREVIAVTSSGREVPRATKVRAITDSGTPNSPAMMMPLSTNRFAPIAIKAAPMTSKRRSFPAELEAVSASAAATSVTSASAAAASGFLPCIA